MFEKMIELAAKGVFKGIWKLLPLVWWLFFIIIWILANDSLSPIQIDAQKLWNSIAAYSQLIIKYGTAVIVISFLATVAFHLLSFLLWVKANLEKQGKELMAIGGLAFQVFIYTGSLCAPFLFFPNPNAFWNFASLGDDLVKFAAFLYLLILCWFNWGGFLELLLKNYENT